MLVAVARHGIRVVSVGTGLLDLYAAASSTSVPEEVQLSPVPAE